MAEGLPVLVNLAANAMPFRKGIAISCDAAAVINDKRCACCARWPRPTFTLKLLLRWRAPERSSPPKAAR